ncbi:unnamed protein product [Oikopleura dioica]|uniref:Uncharacterized protein n=1 Tax=Oikopleura dioica TaxID=34765 RepID=E4XW67_OIKDI|nr:unnamed protein product [Oikopleura dioica]
MITILDKIKLFPTEYDNFINWSWAEAQRYLPDEITREIEIYVGNPAEKFLKFIDDLEKGLLINKSGIERPILNCGTNFLKFLKTILFEEENSLCNFMSSAIEDQKALLFEIHANYENFSRFCDFFVEKLVLMLEDEFLRKYVSEMLMEFGSVPPIFITAGLNMFDTKTAFEIRKFAKWEKLECTYQPQWSEWSQCSETCNGGYQFRAQICMDKTRSQVSEILCGEDQLFSESAECNTFECALPCSVSASPPDANFDRGSFKIDCKNRKLTVFPFTIEEGRIQVGERTYPARRIASFDFSENYFDDSEWQKITNFIAQTHKTKEFNFAKNKFHSVPVSALQKLTKNAALNLDENEICKFNCDDFDLREFSGRLNLCLTNNPIETIPFELVPAISYFNKFEFNDGIIGRNRTD